MPDMTKTQLNNTIKHYLKYKDYEGAKNHIKSFGIQIKDYNIELELEKIDKLIKEDKEE